MTSKRVLVCDDEPSLARLLQVTLDSEGYDVLLASDGETAVKCIENDRPDLVLLDVMMPVLDGWGVLERIRAMPRRPRVICLTAKTNRRDLVKGWTLGADDYLTKPFGIDQLLALAREVLERDDAECEAIRAKAIADLGGG